MADLIARINQTVEWVCAGTSDVLSCTDVSKQVRNGLQYETDFSMATATITVTLESGVTKTVTAETADANVGLIGKDFAMSAVSVTNVAAGTYTVRFSQ